MIMDQQDRDMLIRIDTRQESMGREIGEIKIQISKTDCQTHAEKILTLERITWGTFVIAMGAIVRSFWSAFTK